MPLARIITRTPDAVVTAAEHLRSRGYTVELMDPADSRTQSSDLEIDATDCTDDEALARAMKALGSDGEALPRRKVIAYDITGRPVEFEGEGETDETVPRGNIFADAARTIVSTIRELGDDLRLSTGHLREWFQEGRESIRKHREEREQERLERERELEEAGRRRQEEIAAAQAENARREQEEDARRSAAQEARGRLEAEERERRAAAERERKAAMKAEAERRREEQERARHEAMVARERQLREDRERQLRDQEEQQLAAAERERLAREQREREAQSQDDRLRAAGDRERLAREQRERDAIERFRREAHLDANRERFAVEQARASQQTAPAQAAIVHRPRPSWRSKRERDWTRAMIGAVILASLVTLGWVAYDSRHPASPLSNSDLVRSQSISQPVPFGAATVAPPQAQPVVHTPTQPISPLPQASAAPQAPAPQRRPQKQSPRHRRKTSAATNSQDAGDEVVVRRYPGSGSGNPGQTAAKSGTTRRYSDLDD